MISPLSSATARMTAFGWGVFLSDGTLGNLAANDPASVGAIQALQEFVKVMIAASNYSRCVVSIHYLPNTPTDKKRRFRIDTVHSDKSD